MQHQAWEQVKNENEERIHTRLEQRRGIKNENEEQRDTRLEDT